VKLRSELLYEHSKYLQEKRIETKYNKNLEEMKSCTFKPETNLKNKDPYIKENDQY